MILDWWLSPELQVGTHADKIGGSSDKLAQETSGALPGMETGQTASEESRRGCEDLRHGVQGGVLFLFLASQETDDQVHASMSLSSSHSKVCPVF